MAYAHNVAVGFVAADGRRTYTIQHVYGYGASPANDDAVKQAALDQVTPFVRSRVTYVSIDVRPDGSGPIGDLWAASERIRAPNPNHWR
jgi:hypothetical protein